MSQADDQALFIREQLEDMFGKRVTERILTDVWLKCQRLKRRIEAMPVDEARKVLRRIAGRVRIDQHREETDLFGRKGAKKPVRGVQLDEEQI